MDQVKLENSLAQHQCLFSLIKQCTIKLKEIENYQDLKLKGEITFYTIPHTIFIGTFARLLVENFVHGSRGSTWGLRF